jgi:hypothetical protein
MIGVPCGGSVWGADYYLACLSWLKMQRAAGLLGQRRLRKATEATGGVCLQYAASYGGEQ